MQRRDFSRNLALMASTAFFPIWALSKNTDYPIKPVKVIVGSSAGALTDLATRLYGEKLTNILNQSFVVENLPGASSIIATKNLIKSSNDGYTLLTIANTVFTLPYLSKKADYKPSKDFTIIAELARGPGMLVVNAKSKYHSLKDLIEDARKRPEQVSYASGGMGTTSHLPMEMFQSEANIKMLHIPYKGIAPGVVDLLGGRVDALMGTPTSMLSAIKAGNLRPLAITSENRVEEFPNVPTFKELGYPQATYMIFISLVGPANIPQEVVEKLAKAINEVKKDPAVINKLKELGQSIDPQMSDINNLKKFLFEDETKYANLIIQKNIQID